MHRLLTNNVATNHVGTVITDILELAGKKPNRVPCTSTVREMSLQRLVIAHQQVAEELPSQENTTFETEVGGSLLPMWT